MEDRVWIRYVPGSNWEYMVRLAAVGRQRDVDSQLWSRTSQPGDNKRCLAPHFLPVDVGPAFRSFVSTFIYMTRHESIYLGRASADTERNCIVPDFVEGEYGEGDGAEPEIGVADGSAVVKVKVFHGHGHMHDAVDGVGEAVVHRKELTEDLGAEAVIGTGERRQVPV